MEGNRLEIAPHSGDFAAQASVQRGPTQHLFAPMGFLDDTWFHRSYWVFGRSFAGGHGGYYQAGKYTPSGRLLVFDDDNVYGYGRKPEYLKWTTTIEHQLFASSKEPPPQARSDADEKVVGGKRNAAEASTMIRFGKPAGINPTKKPLTVEAWIQADRPDGVVLAHGGPAVGYALVLQGGKPQFLVRTKEEVTIAKSKVETVGRWTHLVGVLNEGKQVKLYINGKLVDEVQAPSLLPSEPAQGLEVGADDAGAVGNYKSPLGFTGMIDEVRVYHAVLSDEEIADHASTTDRTPTDDRRLVLACTFEGGTAEDVSGNGHDGELVSALSTKGKFGRAMQFSFRQSQASGSFVEHLWAQDVPLMVRAMVKANDKLFIAGPPDLIDEEETFQRTMARDPNLASQLVQQDEALSGKSGGLMRVVAAADGSTLAEYKLDTLPAWDGMAAANGRLFLSTTDGNVICYAAD
jgi:hypothetical protein